ncbi:MAG: hypothetical protein FJX76_24255 [Armatimonadetes bacterium]|nr:hypothetical protein [Armatimonadota bacterium]
MKFFVDRCAGRRLAEWLRAEGHDVVCAWERGEDPGDLDLLEMAHSEGRVLVTIDQDFGHLIFAGGTSHSGVVRLPDVSAGRRIELMRDVMARHEKDLETGSIITVRSMVGLYHTESGSPAQSTDEPGRWLSVARPWWHENENKALPKCCPDVNSVLRRRQRLPVNPALQGVPGQLAAANQLQGQQAEFRRVEELGGGVNRPGVLHEPLAV